jgi:hypothetical protein
MRLPFDEQEVSEAFDRNAFQRGADYAERGRVRRLEVGGQGHRLQAQVRGSRRTPYRVDVSVDDGRGRRILSYCTCPVGVQCKHGAAVLLPALDELGPGLPRTPPPPPRAAAPRPPRPPPPPPDPLAGAVGDWLQRLAGTLGEAPARAGPPPEEVIYVLRLQPHGERRPAVLEPRIARRLKAGGWGADRPYEAQSLAWSSARFVRAEDALIPAS